jgi:hypothetical protein
MGELLKNRLMSNLIKIIGTGKSKHMPKGEVYYEIAEMADLLVSKGAAVYENSEIEEEKVQVVPEKKKQITRPSTKKTK